MASVVQEAVAKWRARLKELEDQIAPLAQEADELRHAISLHRDGDRPARSRRSRTKRPTASRAKRPARPARAQKASRPTASRATGATKPARASAEAARRRRPQRAGHRQTILYALRATPAGMTAGELATQTGLKRTTLAPALSLMAKRGELKKAARGYRL
jgi:TolA-binding protein